MLAIHAHSAGLAWQAAVRAVLARGASIQDDGQDLLELLDAFVEVDDPLVHDEVLAAHGDPEMIRWMHANFLEQDPIEGWGYSYGSRLLGLHGVDQLARATRTLRRRPEAKSVTLGFLHPPGDEHHVPCVVSLDLKIRQGSLQGRAFLRSQDAGRKLYADVLALGAVLDRVARPLGVSLGPLRLYIASLHIYGTQQAELRARFAPGAP